MSVQDTVLIVEDHDLTRESYAEWLRAAGFKVIEATTKAVALMHLDRLDLSAIVLDLILPNGHGREVVEALKAKRDDVGVVVVSGFPDSPRFDLPVTSSLRKPFPRGVLLHAVVKAIETYTDPVKAIRASTRRLGNSHKKKN